MKRFISFSGGVESTTMCVLYGKGATAIWADTGAEHEPMYERLRLVEESISALHGGDFSIVRVKGNVKVKGNFVSTLTDAIIGWSYMPSSMMRYCTGRFKIEPIDNYLMSLNEPVELMIGFNADEEAGKDRTGNYMKAKNVRYSYPLYDDGYSRSDCEEILRANNLHPDFPIYMQRGGCKYCFFKSIAEYKAMFLFARKEFDEVRQLEESVQDKRKKFFAMSVSQRAFSDIQREVESEIRQWGIDEVKSWYKTIASHEPCGAFCHR